MNKPKKQNLDNLRHSCAHLLAAAVLELYPDAKPTIGPPIEDGFYYDFDNLKISEDELGKIEKKMHEIVKSWHKFERIEVTMEEVKKQFKDNPYKIELAKEFIEKKEKLTLYKSGDFIDLCRGGHIENPARNLKHFKLLSVAGAYWRGSEKNVMLTRIYGTIFPTDKELKEYLHVQEEAKKRDHRKLGPALELFMFHETAPGMPYWLPKGLVILNELIDFWRIEHAKRGYLEISTPLVNKRKLWEISGHWKHYRENMFIANMGKEEVYGIKAMNCPNAMIVFGSKLRSYRDLPLRLSDTDTLHRYEKSGTLSGLLRVRSFRQDDSHNFITEEQIEKEYQEIFEIADKFYGIFDLEFSYRLGTRPEKYMGNQKTWDKAEEALKRILDKSGKDYFILEGDGAFYGPKVDILMKDILGREWQMGTIQLDFQQPKRFNLKYIDKDGKEKTPVVIHRVIYGSLERFIGILIEHFAGNFPVWLSPVQVKVLPVSEKVIGYAKNVSQKLKEENIRVELDERSETLPSKVRDAQIEKVPYMLIVGDKEESKNKVALRLRTEKDLGQMNLKDFIDKIKFKIETKALDLV
jgi:threonyl-tRNA synthetase